MRGGLTRRGTSTLRTAAGHGARLHSYDRVNASRASAVRTCAYLIPTTQNPARSLGLLFISVHKVEHPISASLHRSARPCRHPRPRLSARYCPSPQPRRANDGTHGTALTCVFAFSPFLNIAPVPAPTTAPPTVDFRSLPVAAPIAAPATAPAAVLSMAIPEVEK